MDYYKLICERKSIRDFVDDPVSEATLDALRAYFPQAMRLRTDIETALVLAKPDEKLFEGATGYAGVLVRAPHYAVLLSEQAEGDLENAGYVGADLTLWLTDAGLDHCWLTIRDGEAIKRAFDLHTGKRVVAVIAFGHGRKQKKTFALDIENESKVEVIRRDGHVAPKVGVNEFVYQGVWGEPQYVTDIDDALDLKYAFLAASMAPSYLNLQPYRLIWDGGCVALVLIPSERTEESDARLNAGIVMQHFTAALSGYRPKPPAWTLGAPEKDYHLPEGCRVWAYCRA